MSTPDQPAGPGLTRKQLREIRMTGVTPIVIPDAGEPPIDERGTEAPIDGPASDTNAAEPAKAPALAEAPAPAVPLPRAAVPVVAPPPPTPDAQVDLGVSPLTRRQAREQERIRTASVPVITPDVAAAPVPSRWAPPAPPAQPAAPESAEASEASEATVEEASAEEVPAPGPGVEAAPETEVADGTDVADEADTDAEPEAEPVSAVEQAAEPEPEPEPAADPEPLAQAESEKPADVVPADERPLLRPEFGSTLLAGGGLAEALAPSFDELVARGASSTGSLATPNALILSQSSDGPLTSPVTATGEVLITGTFALPEGLGSQGHAHGTTDGKEADSVLIDGELPPASSPTPIAASAAISTVKGTGEIIRPPAPEKGNKLMLGLAITAGVLAVALVGVLILAFVTGVL